MQDFSPPAELEERLGYRFQDPALLRTALTHRSFMHENPGEDEAADNQRLEFLGDAVLSLAVSTLLYRAHPEHREGDLTRMRAGLVNEGRLAELARELGLAEHLVLGRGEETGGGRDKPSILADALEAVLASVYLDGGYAAAAAVVERLFADLILQSAEEGLFQDYKTRLQELTQADFNQTPDYRLTGAEGPDHDRTFEVTLALGSIDLAVGRGRSKKAAERNAARAALKKLEQG